MQNESGSGVRGSKRIDRELLPRPSAAADARHALDLLERYVAPQQLDDLRLLITEVVSNALKHGKLGARDRLHVCVNLTGDHVHVEVTQPGPAFSGHPSSRSRWQESGWGLSLLDGIAQRWGVRADPTTVWFDVSRS